MSINAIRQNYPATILLNDVSQLIYFISYTACYPRQTKNSYYFFPTIFRNIKSKKSTFFTSYPTDFKKSSGLPTLMSYMIVYKIILHKKLLLGEMGEKPFTQRSYGKPKKVNWFYHLVEYFRKVSFLVYVLFMPTCTGSKVYWCIVYMRASLFFLEFSFSSLQLIYRRRLKLRVDFFSLQSKK